MKLSRGAGVAGAVVALSLIPATAEAQTLLRGEVGPYRTITLKTAEGADVTRLQAGVFVFRIRDRAAFHNFHIRGPGVDRALTSVRFVGTKSVTLRLRTGVYRFFCDPHARSMRGTFRVI